MDQQEAVMGTKTGISWTEATWNPIRGCVRVSEGCRFCYAEAVAARFSGEGQPYEGLAKLVTPAGSATQEPRWTGAVQLVEDHLLDPIKWRKPKVIFVNSMSDLFYEKIPLAYVDRIMAVMVLAQHHTYQVLTKRADRMRDYLNDPEMPARVMAIVEELKPNSLWNGSVYQARYWLIEEKRPVPHIWWGVSAEDQSAADERIPALLDAQAAVRFVSYEPALGPINFSAIKADFTAAPDSHFMIDAIRGGIWDEANGQISTGGKDVAAIDWIIIGGESHQDKKRARPFDIAWARSLIKDAQDEGHSAIYVKQLGSNPVDGETPLVIPGRKSDDPALWPEDVRIQQYPEAAHD